MTVIIHRLDNFDVYRTLPIRPEIICMHEVDCFKGGPEPLEKESHEFLGSKRDDRFSNPFF